MATSVADLSINVSANIANAVEGMQRLGSSVDSLTGKFDSLAIFMKGLGGVVAIRGLAEIVTSVVDAAARLDDLSERTGASVEALSKFAGVARITGQDLGAVEQATSKLSKSIAEAQDGGSKAAKAFEAFGVNIRDASGSLKNSGALMEELARKQQLFGDGAGKAAAMMQLFGKSGAELIPFLNDYVRLSDQVSETTTDQAKQAETFNIQLGVLRENFNKLLRDSILPLLPQMIEVVRSFESLGRTIANLSPSGRGPLEAFLQSIKETNRETIGEIEFLKQAYINFQIWWERSSKVDIAKTLLGAKPQRFEGMIEPGAAREAAVLAESAREVARAFKELDDGRSGNRWARDITFNTKEAKKSVDAFAGALESMKKSLRSAEIEAGNLGKSIGEQIAPSLKRLADAMDSPAWAKASAAQKELARSNAENEAGVWRLIQAYKAQEKVQEDLIRVRERTSAIEQRALETLNNYSAGLVEQLAALRREGEEIGKTEEQLQALTLARIDDTIRAKEQVLASFENIEGAEAYADALRTQINLLKQIKDQTASNQTANTLADQAKLARDSWLKTIEDITNAGAGFLEDLFNNGSKAFENLWENFKRWALAAFAKIAAQQIVVQLTGQLGMQGGAGGIASLLGGGGAAGGGILDSLGSLFGQGGGGLGGLVSGALSSFALSGAGTALGLSAAIPASALGAGAAAWGGAAAAATGAGVALTGLGSAALAAIPVVGWIAAAGLALYSIFGSDDPSETKGRIGIRAPGSDRGQFEDQKTTESLLGDIGFLDVDTMYFSGEVAKVLTDMLGSALDAFASRMDSEGVDRLSKILQETTFEAFEGELSTEDFLNRFGGDMLKEVVGIAFQELEPALATVIAGFSGTAQEIANFSNSLLGIYDATRDLPEAVRANIIGALDATQETADKVLAFAAVLMAFGDTIDGVRPQLEALDPESIIAFVEALGGAQLMAQQFAFLAQNFLTDAERLSQATDQLSVAFEAVGLTIEDLANAGLTSFPKTHEEFIRLLGSFDLTTESGRDLYAAVLALSQAFVAINGTAQQAAEATLQQAEANRQLVESAAEFFGANFYSPLEQASATVAAAIAEVDAAANSLGVSIPRSISGFRALIESIDTSTDAGRALFDALIVLAPAIYDINTAFNDVAGSVSNATDSLSALQSQAEAFMEMVRNEAATLTQSRIAAIDALVSGIGGDLGDQMALKIKLINEQIQQALADVGSSDPGRQLRGFEALKELQVPISYGSTQPSGLSPMILALTRDLARFTVLEAQFDAKRAEQLLNLEKWYAAQQELFRQSASAGGDYTEALTALEAEFKRKWDEIIKGTGEGVEATIGELERLRATLAKWLQSLNVGELSPLKPLDRLAAAKKQFEEQLKLALGGDKDALAGITGFADQYLRIARDLYKSSSAYTDIFDFVTRMIAELAGTAPTGLPYPPELPPRTPALPFPPELPPLTPIPPGWVPPLDLELMRGEVSEQWDVGASAIAAALPANGGRLASSEDMMILAKHVDAVVDAIAALADVNSEDSRQEVEGLAKVRSTIALTFENRK